MIKARTSAKPKTAVSRRGRNQRQQEKALLQRRVAEGKQRAKKALSWAGKTALACLALTVSGTLVFFADRGLSSLGWLSIKSIEIKGLSHLNAADVLATTGLEVGRNWLFLSAASGEKALSQSSGIARAEIRRVFPSRVLIDVKESEPVALARQGGWVGLFEDGSLREGEAWLGQDLPVLEGLGKLSPHRRKALCAFLARVRNENPQTFARFSQVTPQSGTSAEVILRSGSARVLLNPEAKSLNSLDFLETLMRDHASSWRVGASIDLRVPGHAYVL